MAGRFAVVQQGPPIEVFALTRAFQDDTEPTKVNLGVGGMWTGYINLHYNGLHLIIISIECLQLIELTKGNHGFCPLLGRLRKA